MSGFKTLVSSLSGRNRLRSSSSSANLKTYEPASGKASAPGVQKDKAGIRENIRDIRLFFSSSQKSKNNHKDEESAGQGTSTSNLCPPIVCQVDNKRPLSAPNLTLVSSANIHQIPPQSAFESNAAVEDKQPSRRAEHFDKLKEALEQDLKHDELEDIFGQDIDESTIDAMLIVENAVRSLRAKAEQNATGKFKRALVVLEKAAKIGDVAIRHHPDVVVMVWAALRLLLQSAIDHMELKQLIEDTIENIARALATSAFYETVYISSNDKSVARLGNAIIELYAAVIVFCIKTKKHVDKFNIGKSVMRTLTSVNLELQSLAAKIEAKERVLHDFASMANTEDQQRRFQELQSLIKEMRNDQKAALEETALELALTEKQEETLRQSRIWLGGIERDLEFEKNWKLHTDGTCEWILSNELFKSWTVGEVEVLLINGIPGAGKSVLQSFILHKLKEQRSQNPQSCGPVLHFFFKNGNLKTESPVTMMATLIDQLIQEHKSQQFVDLLNTTRKNSNTQQCGDFKQLWDLFLKLVNAYGTQRPRISILVDALDECSDREDFMHCIAYSKLDLKALGTNFLLTSRPEDDIIDAFSSTLNSTASTLTASGYKCSIIKLAEGHINLDIIRFMEDQIKTKKYERLQQFREQLFEVVPKKAQGMFRYAALVLEELLKPSTKDVKKTLASIPSGLNSIYIWILEHLSSDPNDLLLRKTVFNWVALAFRPITINEIALAFAASDQDSKTEFNPAEKLLVDQRQILRVCGSLVEVTQKGTISFTHFSVKEFLLIIPEERIKNNPYNCTNKLVTECLVYDTGIAHGNILQTCMTQLLSSIFLNTLPEQTEDDNMYAVCYWFKHAARSDVQLLHSRETQQNENIINPWPAVCEFLLSSNRYFLTWIKSFPSNAWSFYDTPLFLDEDSKTYQANPIHIIAALGLQIPLKTALKSPELRTGLNIRDHEGKSPLVHAARGGHTDIVKLLLEAGAEVDDKDIIRTPLSFSAARYGRVDDKDSIRTPLSYAAKYGHTQVVKLLLEAGAKVDNNIIGRTPIRLAAENGNIEVVKLLIEASAKVESKNITATRLLFPVDMYGNTYGHTYGHTEVMKFLIEAGAEVDIKDNIERTPLFYAARDGHTEIVKLLIKAGAEVNSKDKDQRTPLCCAARGKHIGTYRRGGHTEAMQLLIEAGAEVDSKDINQRTPLSYAADTRYTGVVKLLIGAGAEVDSKDINQRTPLSHAAENQFTEVVKLLIRAGAELDSKDINQRTPLSYAAANQYTEVVDLLIRCGAKVNSKDINQRTPLSYAAENKIVKLLIRAGAKVDSKDINQRTPLSYAAENQYTEVVKLLIGAGAEVDSKDINDRTPLSHATKYWHVEVARLLIEAGAEVDSKDINHRTPLSYAAEHGHRELTKFLIKAGAELEVKDKDGKTPLDWARIRNRMCIVELLSGDLGTVRFVQKEGV